MSFPQDTPFNRASIKELTADQLVALVEQMRERRMKSYTAYQEAQEAKARLKEQKDKDRFEHVLKMFEKKLNTVDSGLEALSKYAAELKVLNLVLGE